MSRSNAAFAHSGRGAWREPRECPVCGGKGWCQVSRDGTVILCHRHLTDDVREGHAGAYSVHRLREALRGAPTRYIPPPHKARATPDVLHTAYTTVMDHLDLHAEHRRALFARGLHLHQEYRSLPLQGRAALARKVTDAIGIDAAMMVPGIYRATGTHGDYLTLGGSPGLVIPVRDQCSRIIALCIRRDDGEPKYCVVSSARHGGASPGAPMHWPLWSKQHDTVVITEGYLKANVATELMGVRVLGLPGVGAWSLAIDALALITPMPSRVVVAFDADAATNYHVARAQAALVSALKAHQYPVRLFTWPITQGKGIDDFALNQWRTRWKEKHHE